MISDDLYYPADAVIPLLSCSSSHEVDIVVGLLRENGIEVFVDSKEGLLAPYEISVFNYDLPKAKEILAASNKVFETVEQSSSEDSKRRSTITLRILLFLTFLFFGVLSYYILKTSEKFMGWIIGGISFFFLLVFIFSFEWRKKIRRRSSSVR